MSKSSSKRGIQPIYEKNLDGYGAPLISWTKVLARLEQGFTQIPGSGGPDRHTCWLATVNPDGTPHIMPVGILWAEDTLCFSAGASTRKAKNLMRSPHCVITVATYDYDLVVEGEAARVTDEARLQHIADLNAAAGWHPTVRDGSFYAEYSAPSAGPPPWDVYEVTPGTIFALGTSEPYGATRWRF